MTRQEKALKIIELLGGVSNIQSVTHCVTRLRFHLLEDKKEKLAEIKSLDGIMGAQIQGGETQIIIGGEVGKVFKEILKEFPSLSSDGGNRPDTEKKTVFTRVINTLSGILVACLAPIIGGGMLKGILFFLTNQNIIDAAGGTAQILNIASDCMFYFLPFILAVSAAKRFKTNEYMAISLAGVLMYPSLISAASEGIKTIYFLSFLPIKVINYKASVVPIILSVLLLSYVYRFLEAKLPDMLTVIFTPLLTLLFVIPVMLFGIAPLGFYIGEFLAIGIDALIDFAPWFAGFVIAASRPLLVLTGMHHAITPISMQQVATYGYSLIGPMNFMSTMAQATAVFAVYFVIRDKKMKQITMSATISGYLGITEPALYSVLIPYRSALAGAMIGGGLGGLVASMFKVASYASGMPSILSIPNFLGETTVGFFIALAVTLIATFLITIVLSKSVFKINEENACPETTAMSYGAPSAGSLITYEVFSPVNGDIFPMKDVKDETFASEVLGKGIAIHPKDGRIVAPIDCKVNAIFETKHAIGLKTNGGVEILIHVGINTVNLKGRYFDIKCSVDEEVKQGDLLLTFDKEAIEKEGYDTCIVMIVSNTNDFLSVISDNENGVIFEGKRVLTVVK